MNNNNIKSIENSNLIEVYGSTRSIWRGNEWSSVQVKIKLADYFLLDHEVGSRFVLRAYVKPESSESYTTHDSEHVNVWLNRSRGGDEKEFSVTSDRYISLDLEIHSDLFSDKNEEFTIIVAAEDMIEIDELYFGRSQKI